MKHSNISFKVLLQDCSSTSTRFRGLTPIRHHASLNTTHEQYKHPEILNPVKVLHNTMGLLLKKKASCSGGR